MAFQQSDLDALDSALKQGEKRVTYGDKTVEFRSLAELREARAFVQAELAKAAGTRVRQVRLYAGGKGA